MEKGVKMKIGDRARFTLALLIAGWVVCGASAIWAITATRDLMWNHLPSWFALLWDVFVVFVAFALPVKVAVLMKSLRSGQ
jgi:hypothetical protein